MAFIKKKKGWEIPENQATDESVYNDRRTFLKSMGFTGLGLLGLLLSCGSSSSSEINRLYPPDFAANAQGKNLYPFKRNEKFVLDRSITDEATVLKYNNFYEFSSDKDDVWKLVEKFKTNPWEVEVSGLIKKKGKYTVDDFLKLMPVEERLYRHRCVEAWAMAVPWTGFPMKAFIKWVEPLSSAKFMKFTTFFRPDEARGQRFKIWQPWPYTEGLTIEEAMNDLTLLVTGLYGKPVSKQNGAPVRLVVPWKYGYKSIKSIVKIEFTATQPKTFWNTVAPDEYDFFANVNPKIPHPRWSQEKEKLIGTWQTRPTLLYNGYGEWVAHLYK